jgi:TFIIF-interacting CTD phosphatase-like protein
LNELDFKPIGVNEVDILPIWFFSAIFCYREAGFTQAGNNCVKVVGDKRKVRQSHLMTAKIAIYTFTVIAKYQILVVIAKV